MTDNAKEERTKKIIRHAIRFFFFLAETISYCHSKNRKLIKKIAEITINFVQFFMSTLTSSTSTSAQPAGGEQG